MTERIPPPFGAFRTVRPMRRRHDLVLRLHDALRGDGAFAARVLSAPFVVTYSGYAVATDAPASGYRRTPRPSCSAVPSACRSVGTRP
jgi:hypothetical protein